MTAHSTPAEQGDGGGPRRVRRTSTGIAAVVVVLIVAAGLLLALRGGGSSPQDIARSGSWILAAARGGCEQSRRGPGWAD